MRNFLLSILMILTAATSFGQCCNFSNYILTFDDSTHSSHLEIDLLSNPNNIWQIGMPQKTFFTSAVSLPNVIITDSINYYPTNDTSIFIIKNISEGGGFQMPQTVVLSGQYFVNSDSLTDYGTIEFSPDNGTTWIDLINDITYSNYYYWHTPKPVLTGNSYYWEPFYVNIAELGPIFNIQFGDTILYRFTFISDNIQTNKDGLMFDNFAFEDLFGGIQAIQNENLISVYPNPTAGHLTIHRENNDGKQTIQILNYTGQILYENQNFTGETIDTRQLNNGVYLLKYSDTKSCSVKKIIVNH